MIEVRSFGSFPDLAHLRLEINALNLASAHPDPFSTLEFYENYLRHDQLPPQTHWQLRFLAAFLDDRLVGYLPLKQSFHRALGLRGSTISFFSVHDVDRPHLISEPEHTEAVAQAFLRCLFDRGGWSLLEFEQQGLDSPLFEQALKLVPKGYRIRQWPSWSNWTIRNRWDSLDAYFRDFSRKFRSNISRQMRGLLAAGDVQLIGSSALADTPALLTLYRGIEARSWKAQAGLTIGRNPARIGYFEGLLKSDQPMRISISLLLLDGIPIAGLINGAYGRGLFAMQVVFDGRFSKLSPGSAMLLMGMQEAIVGQYQFFNLLSGFDYFKNRWLAELTETRCTQIYRIDSPIFWRRCIGDLFRKAASIVRKSWPRLVGQRSEESKWISASQAASVSGSELKYTLSGVWPSSAVCGRC